VDGEISIDGGHASGTLRVVVRLSGREGVADVAAGRPVAELVPDLLRAVLGESDDAALAAQLPWAVGPPGRQSLAEAGTLAEQGIADGAVLLLRPVSQWRRPAPEPPTPAAGMADAGDLLLPRERTAAALPERRPVLARLAAAAGEVLSRDRILPPGPLLPMAPAAGTYVPPAQLTVLRRPGALERGRERWRESAYERRLVTAIQGPQLRRCATVAVMSPKGGVGKTTLSVLLGTLFALLRRDRVVAVDASPDFGTLSRSLAPRHPVYLDDLRALLDGPELTVAALDSHLGRAAHGLMVVPVPGEPARTARLDEAAYTSVLRRLRTVMGMVVLDCGTGLRDESARAALAAADQVLLVTDADPATASLVAESATLLRAHDAPAWLVVNRMTRASSGLLDVLETTVPHARGLLALPDDRGAAAHVAAGTFDWRDAPAGWRIAVAELAASLVAAWPRQGLSG
jgi:MinD-like ATPase involved in chromosome partitioning or flagellar assembly